MADLPVRPEVVARLVAYPEWSARDARIAERSGYRCAYCDLDFLASFINYKLWCKDHVIPIHGGGKDEESNIVAACWPCNKFKGGHWNPQDHTRPDATREELIQIARDRVQKNIRDFEQRVIARDRAIVGYEPTLAAGVDNRR